MSSDDALMLRETLRSRSWAISRLSSLMEKGDMVDQGGRGDSSYIDGPTEGKDKKWTREQSSQWNLPPGPKLHNPQPTQFAQLPMRNGSTASTRRECHNGRARVTTVCASTSTGKCTRKEVYAPRPPAPQSARRGIAPICRSRLAGGTRGSLPCEPGRRSGRVPGHSKARTVGL